jgi:DNA-binding transcriptional MerR regulator
MMAWEIGKTEYTETEAALALGVSIDQLRTLVRRHVIVEDPESDGVVLSYRPTDLLLLRMLAQKEFVQREAAAV